MTSRTSERILQRFLASFLSHDYKIYGRKHKNAHGDELLRCGKISAQMTFTNHDGFLLGGYRVIDTKYYRLEADHWQYSRAGIFRRMCI